MAELSKQRGEESIECELFSTSVGNISVSLVRGEIINERGTHSRRS